MRSKYLNKKFDGWIVVGVMNQGKSHKKFILVGPEYENVRGTFREQIVVCDSELSNVAKGKITIKNIRNNRLDRWMQNTELNCFDIECVSYKTYESLLKEYGMEV